MIDPSCVATSAMVRSAKAEDVSVLWEMKRKLASAQGTEVSLRASPQEWLRDAFGACPRFNAFVAEQDSAVVGMVTCNEHYYTALAGTTMHIQDLFVEPDYRRRAIAKLLLSRVAAFAIEKGCPLIELSVHKQNPARRLYRALGFEPVRDNLAYVAALESMTIMAGLGAHQQLRVINSVLSHSSAKRVPD